MATLAFVLAVVIAACIPDLGLFGSIALLFGGGYYTFKVFQSIRKQRAIRDYSTPAETKNTKVSELGCLAVFCLLLGGGIFWGYTLPTYMKHREREHRIEVEAIAARCDFKTYKALYDAQEITAKREIDRIQYSNPILDADTAAKLMLLLTGSQETDSGDQGRVAYWLLNKEASPQRTALFAILAPDRSVNLNVYLRLEEAPAPDTEALTALEPVLKENLGASLSLGRLDLFKKGLSLGGDPYAKDRYLVLNYANQGTAFLEACRTGNMEALRLILACRAPTVEELDKALSQEGNSEEINALLREARDVQP